MGTYNSNKNNGFQKHSQEQAEIALKLTQYYRSSIHIFPYRSKTKTEHYHCLPFIHSISGPYQNDLLPAVYFYSLHLLVMCALQYQSPLIQLLLNCGNYAMKMQMVMPESWGLVCSKLLPFIINPSLQHVLFSSSTVSNQQIKQT